MRLRARFVIFVDRFKRRVRQGIKSGLHQTAALIRLEARQSIRIRKKASLPGTPPNSRTRAGLREINYHVNEAGTGAYIGPRKFRNSNSLNRPVPNVHERGGIALARGRRGRSAFLKRFPERSFMYRAVKTLKSKGKLSSKFKFMLRSY
jgi:hypothetical protein